MKFDWYQATIHADSKDVLRRVSLLGDETVLNERVGKMYRYETGYEVKKQGNTVARVALDLGSNQRSPHAWATSDDAPAFADLLRNEWLDHHTVTRADSCQDYVDKTAFKRLCGVGRRIAKDHRLSFAKVCDELNSTAGATQYIGAPSSEYRGRVYEKGWEVVAKASSSRLIRNVMTSEQAKIRVPGIDRDCHPSEWVRAEFQARPADKIARLAAAHATPEELWTFTEWAHEFARDALALELERAYIRQRKVTNDEKALWFMCSQYGGMLSRLRADLGDWECVGLTIADIIREQADMKK